MRCHNFCRNVTSFERHVAYFIKCVWSTRLPIPFVLKSRWIHRFPLELQLLKLLASMLTLTVRVFRFREGNVFNQVCPSTRGGFWSDCISVYEPLFLGTWEPPYPSTQQLKTLHIYCAIHSLISKRCFLRLKGFLVYAT